MFVTNVTTSKRWTKRMEPCDHPFKVGVNLGDLKHIRGKCSISTSPWTNQSINQSINQSLDQSLNHSITQSLTHSLNQSINQFINLSIYLSIYFFIKPPQLCNKSIVQSFNSIVNLSKHIYLATWKIWKPRRFLPPASPSRACMEVLVTRDPNGLRHLQTAHAAAGAG